MVAWIVCILGWTFVIARPEAYTSSTRIFLDTATNDLFGYAEIECEEQWDAIASTDVCRRWWSHMRDLMPTNPDDSPISRDLHEVFHIGAR